MKTPAVKKNTGVNTDCVKKVEQTPCRPDMLTVKMEIIPMVEAEDK